MDVPQNNCSKILQNSEHSINSGSFLINIEKFVQSWDSDIEVEIKKHGSLNSLGISMDGQDILLFIVLVFSPKAYWFLWILL